MYRQNKLIYVFIYVCLYSIVVSFSFVIFFFFRPFVYLDNEKSLIICKKNNLAYYIGPNYIYGLGKELNDYNSKKAEKLCQYNVIRDYKNTYKDIKMGNYSQNFFYIKNSSWLNAIVMALGFFLIGVFLINSGIKTTQFLFIGIVAGSIFFLLFLYEPTKTNFCKKKVVIEVVNFRNSVYKSGVVSMSDEEAYIKTQVPKLIKQCLKD